MCRGLSLAKNDGGASAGSARDIAGAAVKRFVR